MNPFPDLLTAVALLGLFAGAETARTAGVPAETTRRLSHMLGASIAALFPLYLGLGDVLLLAVLFTAVLGTTWAGRWLRSVHGVSRPTAGALLFPAGIALAALVCWSHPAAFSYAVLVLALADPAASLLGKRLDRPGWPVAGGRKSLAGSLAFLAVSALLVLSFGAAAGHPRPLAALLCATVLAAVEGSLGYGLDNLPLPLVAGMLGERWLGL